MYSYARSRTPWSAEWHGTATPGLDPLNPPSLPVTARADGSAVRPEGQVFRRWLRAAAGPSGATAR